MNIKSTRIFFLILQMSKNIETAQTYNMKSFSASITDIKPVFQVRLILL